MKPSLAGSDMIVTTMSGRAPIFAFWTLPLAPALTTT